MIRKFLAAAIVFSLFFASCGQMDTLFFQAGNYRVTARVGQYTLDECSIVESDTPIRPYFIESVDDDPDIRGLIVFLQSLNGEVISKKLLYTTDPAKAAPDAGSGGNKTDTIQAGSPAEDSETLSGDPADFGEENGSGGDASTDGASSTTEETGEPGEYADAYRFRESKTILEPSIRYTEDAIYVKKLNGDLPSLFLPEELEAGQYILVFQVLGKEDILYRVNKPIYYIADSEFTLDDIHIYLPGFFGESHIVQPGLPIMLETNLAAGTDLEPYLVWYNGKKRVHEGYVSDGAACFLWQAPPQTGFHVLKVEAFPFKPRTTRAPVPTGRIKELSLPISTKVEKLNNSRALYDAPSGTETGFSENHLVAARWYQFFANLDDSAGTGGGKNTLSPVNHAPEWLPGAGIFGVAIGPHHRFSIPGPLFIPPAQGGIDGRLLFRFVPLADGTVFSASFKLENSLETLELRLSRARETLILNYSAGAVSGEKTAPLAAGQNDELITAVLGFGAANGRLSVSLALDAAAQFLPDESIPLPGPLTGYGTFQIGADITPVKSDFTGARGRMATGTAGNTGGAQTGFDQTTADSSGAEAGQGFARGAENTVPMTAVLDEIIITITRSVPANNNTQTAASEEPASFAEDTEETVENEEPDTETAQAALSPEPAVLKQPRPESESETRTIPVSDGTQTSGKAPDAVETRTTPVSDGNQTSGKASDAVEVQPPDESRVPVPAETPAVSVPPAPAEDAEQGENNDLSLFQTRESGGTGPLEPQAAP
jgi:hypothetical protein